MCVAGNVTGLSSFVVERRVRIGAAMYKRSLPPVLDVKRFVSFNNIPVRLDDSMRSTPYDRLLRRNITGSFGLDLSMRPMLNGGLMF